MGELLSSRKLAVRETAKQPQFNNARALIVLAEQNSWAERCANDSRDSTWIFLANFAAVVRWAVRKKNQQFINTRAIIVLAEQNCWATCGSLRQRLSSSVPAWIFFCQICSSRKLAVSETSKQQKFNNARVIIVLAEQKNGRFVIISQVSGARNSHSSTMHVPLLS